MCGAGELIYKIKSKSPLRRFGEGPAGSVREMSYVKIKMVVSGYRGPLSASLEVHVALRMVASRTSHEQREENQNLVRCKPGKSGKPTSSRLPTRAIYMAPDAAATGSGNAALPISWSNMSVYLGGKTVLQPCSGEVVAGACLAIMGPSGSGKTTMLNALSRRGPMSGGEVLYGSKPWRAALRRRVAFVEQDDQVFANLTVRETLTFGAMLRLPNRSPAECAAALARVEQLIALLRLDKCADTRVGDSSASERRGVSGGERKRLCIASELLPSPSLLFCDEPTSGLDSSLALVVASALAELAATASVTIICSIHQPSSQTFACFSDLLLLDSGHAVYHGPCSGVASHLTSLGAPCPTGWSHSDWMLEVIVGRKVPIDTLVEAQRQAQRKRDDGNSGGEKDAHGGGGALESDEDDARNTWRHEAMVLTQRGWRMLRTSGLWSNELGAMHGFNGIICAGTWFRIGFEEGEWRRARVRIESGMGASLPHTQSACV